MCNCSPDQVIVNWKLKGIPQTIPPLFIDSIMTISKSIQIPYEFEQARGNIIVLREYYKRISQIASVKDFMKGQIETIIPCFFSEQFECSSFVTETSILCPLTKTQARCLDALRRRWAFLLQMEPRGKALLNDVVISILFEMMRIYSHPFLAGCSEQLLLKESKESWRDTFRHSSSKLMICDLLVKSCESVGIYVKSIRLAQYLHRYFEESGFVVVEWS